MKRPLEVLLVVSISTAYTVALFAGVHAYRGPLVAQPLVITFVSFVWVVLCIGFTTAVAFTADNPSAGLFTTTSWYTSGWDSGLSLFSVRIDTWYRYLVVVMYQACVNAPAQRVGTRHIQCTTHR